ncbi:MAG TPA: type I glyceraldehyde-3-phosphate dehydrogenase [Candidatus Saccharimonadales bacterium]|nr:type I glyceraldehyde-3-phosphate dehydrogenase [Candidatus Saccharimonadales bacterium]
MKTKIAINGFGRIGRNAFKIAFERPDLEIVAVNDLTDTKTLAHLLKHDSNYGTYQHDVAFDDQNIKVNGQNIRVLAEKDPAQLPWGDLGVDVVIESTGFFTHHDDLKKHIQAGAKKVILSAPEKDDNDHDTFVIGVNEQSMTADHQVFSNASCTTNCITPVAAVIESNFGIEKALMTTVHSYTASQRLQDAPAKDLREARSAAENIVPTSTGASIAAAKALPALEGIFGGLSVRVPTPVVSLSDFAIVTKRAVTVDEVNAAFKKAAADPYFQGILDVTEDELVSSDFVGNSHSAIVDLSLTNVVGGNLLKVVAWYDNEWGYSNRLVELTADAGKLINGDNMPSPPNPAQSSTPSQPHEELLESPSLDDALPAPEPLGQMPQPTPEHFAAVEHQPVEGVPPPDGPAQTQPIQPPPAIFPDSAGPDHPHNF